MSRYSAKGEKSVAIRRAGNTGIANSVVAVTVLTAASGTFIPNAATRALWIRLVAGGGGGGGAPTTVSTGASGGNAGAYIEMWLNNIAAAYAYNVGAAGTTSAGGSGGTGGTSIFGDYQALGGAGGPAGTTAAAPRIGTVNSVGFNPPVTHDYGNGTRPSRYSKNLTATVVRSGRGADSPLGTGGPELVADAAGGAATGFGSGGGGAVSVAAGTNRAGGAARPGVIIVVEFR